MNDNTDTTERLACIRRFLNGGERIRPKDGGPVRIKPVFQSAPEPDQLVPCPFEASDFQRALDLYGQVCRRLGTADVYLRTPDFQGPLDTLALMMNQTESMIGMLETPDLVKQAFNRITDPFTTADALYEEFGDRVAITPYVASNAQAEFLSMAAPVRS